MSVDSAILLVDKASGWTSHDVIAYTRGVLKIKKIGHSGTLDPMASGLLILLLGKATKLQSEYLGLPKRYAGQITLGTETDTWDAEGKTVKTAQVPSFCKEDLDKVLKELTGKIKQPIPFYSAKKVNGQAMYKKARMGENIERENEVEIYSWDKVAVDGGKIEFEVACSSGTYIRSLAVMIGRRLGTVGHLSGLRRLSIGDFNVKDALGIEKIKTMRAEEIEKWLRIL